uniref:X8 domain-containing protein n=1 Tax=Aegilops tauschii subsp. strangulata TaxID=200361 RepID=A0A453ME09_AEGTS
NLPPLYPEPSATPDPTTMPAPFTNPVAAPTMPAPFTAPVTNPATTVQPAAGAGTGQSTWCVAKAGVTEAALQDGLDFACGMGGADCSALQPMGSCYNPNTIQAHASYAFNAYYQRSPSPASCDFGGAGMLVATNPSNQTLTPTPSLDLLQ